MTRYAGTCRMAASALRLFAAAVCAFNLSCGKAILNGKKFRENHPPLISDIRVMNADGSAVSASKIYSFTEYEVTVTASDPDGHALRYSFASATGSFKDVTATASGCTATFVTGSIKGGTKVALAVSASDPSGGSAGGSIDVGTGKLGPSISVTASRSHIGSDDSTTLTVTSNCSGVFQIQPNNISADETTPLSYTDDVLFYRNDPAEIELSGPASTSDAAFRLPALQGRTPGLDYNDTFSTWVVFRDSLMQTTAVKCPIKVDDVKPSISSVTPSNSATGVGIASPVTITFDEDVTLVSGLTGNPVTLVDQKTAATVSGTLETSGKDVIFTPSAPLSNYHMYSLFVQKTLLSYIPDLAGNAYEGSGTAAAARFTTVSRGKCGMPTITPGSGTFPVSAAQKVTMAADGANPGAKIYYTYADVPTGGSVTPADPTETASAYGGAITVSKNTAFRARAYLEGYEPSDATGTTTIKIRAEKPTGFSATCSGGSVYPGNDSVYTGGTLTIKANAGSGDTVRYSSISADGPACDIGSLADPASTSSTAVPTLTATTVTKCICVKAAVINGFMEPSETAVSRVYCIRNPASLAGLTAIPSLQSYTGSIAWKRVVSSYTGKYLAAIENTSAGSSGGYIWISDDYGMSWVKGTSGTAIARNWTDVCISCVASGANDGMYVAACENTSGSCGIWYSSEYDRTFNNKTGTKPYKWTAITMNADGKNLAATEINSDSHTLTTGYVWVSSDKGENWTNPGGQYNSLSYGWRCISMAASDPAKMIMGVSGDSAWRSEDLKLCASVNANLSATAYSGDGTVYAAAVKNMGVYTNRRNQDPSAEESSISDQLPWSGVALSWTGDKIFAIADSRVSTGNSPTSGEDYIWNDPVSLGGTLTSIACSGTGDRLAVSSSSGDIWLYQDGYGYNTPGQRAWGSTAAAAAGIAVAGDFGLRKEGGYIYTTSDYGRNWTQHRTFWDGSSMQKKWNNAVISADGRTIVAVSFDGYVCRGTSDGTAWRWANLGTPGLDNCSGLCGDSKLSVIAAIRGTLSSTSNQPILISKDKGKTWTQKAGGFGNAWTGVACSSEGKYLAAVLVNGSTDSTTKNIYYSTDAGETWSACGTSGLPSDTTCTHLALADNGEIFYCYGIGVWRASAMANTSWTEITLSGYDNFDEIHTDATGNMISLIARKSTVGQYCVLSSINGGEAFSENVASDYTYLGASPDGLVIYAARNQPSNEIVVVQ